MERVLLVPIIQDPQHMTEVPDDQETPSNSAKTIIKWRRQEARKQRRDIEPSKDNESEAYRPAGAESSGPGTDPQSLDLL